MNQRSPGRARGTWRLKTTGYPAIVRLWRKRLGGLHPLPSLRPGVRAALRFTEAIESVNARHRGAVRARGHLATEQVAMYCRYLVTGSPDHRPRTSALDKCVGGSALNAFRAHLRRCPRHERNLL